MLETMRGVLFGILFAGGLLVPGWLLGRALATPAGLPGAFLGSLAILFQVLLVLDTAGLALETRTVGAAMAAAVLGLFALARHRGLVTAAWPRLTWPRDPAAWLLVPAALGFGAIAVRASLDPLSGFDHVFRWDFLAQQLWRHGTLDFYPPQSAADFTRYAWCDGIAPLATVPAVLLQAAVLYLLVFRLAHGLAGWRAGCCAVALLSASSVLLWGVAMGQETGLTAIALVAVFHFIAQHRAEPGRLWLVWAGLAAAVGGLAREYGLAFVALGALALVLGGARPTGRDWLGYFGAAAALALPWYARNALKTGNPLYSHDVAGLFPTNPVHDGYMRSVAEIVAAQADYGLWLQLFCGLAGPVLLVGFVGGVRSGRRQAAVLVAMAAVVLLWWWSVGQTSGGYLYALRVLTPALALGAVMGGVWLAGWAGRGIRTVAALVLTAAAGDAAVRSLYLPVDASVRWWTKPPAAWLQQRAFTAPWRDSGNWARIAAAAEHRSVVVSDPLTHATLSANGATAVPLFSPAVRFLFAAEAEPHRAGARLRDAGVRFLVLARHNPFTTRQLGSAPFFRKLEETPPTVRTQLFDLYDLHDPAWLPPTPPAVAKP